MIRLQVMRESFADLTPFSGGQTDPDQSESLFLVLVSISPSLMNSCSCHETACGSYFRSRRTYGDSAPGSDCVGGLARMWVFGEDRRSQDEW